MTYFVWFVYLDASICSSYSSRGPCITTLFSSAVVFMLTVLADTCSPIDGVTGKNKRIEKEKHKEKWRQNHSTLLMLQG